MQPVGFLSLALGAWCLYCAAHSFNPATMLVSVLRSPSTAASSIRSASQDVSTTEAQATTETGITRPPSSDYVTVPPGNVSLGSKTGTKDGFPVYGDVNMGPFTGDPISNTFAQHVARGSTAPGVDFVMPAGTQLEAPIAGKLEYTPLADPESGNVLSIVASNGDILSMRHVEGAVSSLVGKAVTPGEVIGYSGGVAGLPGSGDSTGPEVHVDLKLPSGQFVPFYDILPQN